MAITKVINDAVDLNQTSDYSGLRLPVGTTGNVVESFTTDYLVVGGGGSGSLQGAGGAGGLRTSYNNSTTTTNSLAFPSGKTAIATYMLDNDATDISGNYNGTETNITYNTGQYGGAAVFNGSSSYIESGISTNILNSNYTISFWGKSSNSSGSQTFINTSNGSVAFVRIDFSANGNLYFYHRNSASTAYFDASIVSGMADGNWHHVVITKDNTSVKAYKDGSLVGTITSTSGTYSNTTTLQIGRNNYNTNGGNNFDGSIDQVRIYDTALSSTDVSNIYTNEVQANSGGGSAAESSLTLTAGVAYDVTVGAGGADTYSSGGSSANGASSIFSTITSVGGGGAGATSGSASAASGKNGGSGGGAGSNTSGSPGNGTLGQGYIGGTALFYGGSYAGGGGGGALSPGGNSASSTVAGNGGSQLNLAITGTSIGYAGGGGGSLYGTGTVGTNDSSGGAAAPSSSSSVSGESAPFNLGGGGGGANHITGTTNIFGGSGGSGVVILRYPTASVSSFTTTGTLNTPSTTNTVADNNYPTTNTAYYQLDGNANGYLTTNDLGTLDYPSGTGCIALYELNGNANGYLTTTDLSTVNYPVGAGCVALYELNGNANDTSNTYNGSATNVTYNTGAFDQAAVFNGSSSKIEINSPIIDVSNDYTVSMWVNTSDVTTFKAIYENINTNGYLANQSLITIVGGGLRVYTVVTNGSSSIKSYGFSGASLSTNTWHHLVFVLKTNNSHILYVDGTSYSSSYISTTTPTPSGYTTIGYGNGSSFNGKIDQVRIFNTALTQAQVTTLARGVGSAYNGAETNITYNTGAFGKAAVFNGSSSKIALPTSTFSPSTFTLSAWCNVTSDTDENTILELSDNQTYPNHTTIVFSAGSTASSSRFLLRNYTTNQYDYNPSGTVQKNVWKHYAMTYDGSTVKSYINGSLVNSGSLTLSNPVGTITSIQLGLSSGTRYLNGAIDQVRIFNTALSASDVTTLARGVGSAYNGAASNITWQNGRFNQAAVFNGSSSYISGTVGATATTSFSMWVKINDPSTSSGEFIQVFDNNNFAIFIYSGKLNIQYASGSNSNGVAWTISNASNWNHIAGTFTSSSSTLYVNGVQKTESMNNWVNAGSVPYIGNRNSLDGYFNGEIDQVRIFSSALTSSQVTELYEEHYQTKFTDGSDTAIVFTEGTGTVTFSGVNPAPPQGALRTNTSYSEDGSASVIEHYNGTNWKYFDAIKYCTTNTLNFPSGAGCIASYNLDNNVNDIGNTYNGVNSNVTFNASGKFGAAAVFNGSNARIDISNVLTGFTNVYSFSIWAKIDNTNNFSFFSSTTSTASSTYNNVIRFALHQNGNYYFSFGDIYGARLTGTTPSSWTNNNWHNFVFVSTPTQKLAYVDGSLFDSASSTKAVSGLTNIILGHYGTNYADGLMDQVRIFNDSLTSDEVSKLYNNEIACS